jgi:FixJ family two-component response regulator
MSDMGVVHLIDDDDSFLRSMARLLSAEGFAVSCYSDAEALLGEVSPATRGCIVADLDMPGIGGLELQALLSQANASLPMIFLTGHGDIPSTVRAMRDGATDFLEKSATNEQITAAIRLALARDAKEYVARMRLQDLHQRFAKLTNREREVLRHVVRGAMNKQIAASLGINERTVKLHRTSITTKLGVHATAQLATIAHEVQFLECNASAQTASPPAPLAVPSPQTFP